MIDLISKNQHSLTLDEVNQLNALVDKYMLALNELTTYEKTLAPFVAFVIDTGFNYINENHNDLDADWKTWSIVYLKILFFKNKIKDINEIPKLIDDFINHHKEQYQSYKDSIEFFASNFDRDYQFVSRYINR
jgi:hypothetical protein